MENLSRQKLIMLILGAVILALLITGISQLFEKTERKTITAECKASIKAFAEMQKYLEPDEKTIKCPANKITLTGTEKNRKYQLAEEMKTCWDNYQKGQLPLFKGDGVFCSICSIIRTNQNTELNSFAKYLMTAYAPGKDYTYYEFLTDYYTTGSSKVLDEYENAKKRTSTTTKSVNAEESYAVVFNKEDTISFEEDKSYAVIFVHIKGYDRFKTFWETQKATALPKAVQAGGAFTATSGAVLFGLSFMKTATVAAMIPIPEAQFAAVIIAATGATVAIVGYSWEEIEKKIIESNKFEWYSEVLLREYTKDTIKELGCTSVPVQVEEYVS